MVGVVIGHLLAYCLCYVPPHHLHSSSIQMMTLVLHPDDGTPTQQTVFARLLGGLQFVCFLCWFCDYYGYQQLLLAHKPQRWIQGGEFFRLKKEELLIEQ